MLGQLYTLRGTSHFLNRTNDFYQESGPGQVTFFLMSTGGTHKIRTSEKIIQVQNKINSKLKCMGKREGYTKYKV